MVKREPSESWVCEERLLDTAFQILKAAACMELWERSDIPSKLMSEWAPSWLIAMANSDKRKKYAWSHAEYERVRTFRLDEHVWIWRALKSLELKDHEAWNEMSTRFENHQHIPAQLSRHRIAQLRQTFSSEVFRREVLLRFTAENDVLRKWMLAVTRSPRETRFILHARDTSLFYNGIFDFLGKDISVRELWNSTIDCQMYHDGNRESSWEKPLRYALCIMMGTRRLRINNKSPNVMMQMATDILFRSSSPNGLFPGMIEAWTMKPVEEPSIAEKDRDSYYHASFEIPYVLLTHANQIDRVYNPIVESHVGVRKSKLNKDENIGGSDCLQRPESIRKSTHTQPDASLWPGDAEDGQTLLNLSSLLFKPPKIPDHGDLWDGTRRAVSQQRLNIKKTVPFNNLIDSSSIVKLEDEWLFAYPDFFRREKNLVDGDYEAARIKMDDVFRHLEVNRSYRVSDG